MVIFLNLSPTASDLDPLQVENFDSNSTLVVDEDDNCKFRLERVKPDRHISRHDVKNATIELKHSLRFFIL